LIPVPFSIEAHSQDPWSKQIMKDPVLDELGNAGGTCAMLARSGALSILSASETSRD
jgi:hypothetical protein